MSYSEEPSRNGNYEQPAQSFSSMTGSLQGPSLDSLDKRVTALEEKVGISKPVIGPDGKPVEPKKGYFGWGILGMGGGKSRRRSGVRKGRKTKFNVAKRSNRVLHNKR